MISAVWNPLMILYILCLQRINSTEWGHLSFANINTLTDCTVHLETKRERGGERESKVDIVLIIYRLYESGCPTSYAIHLSAAYINIIQLLIENRVLVNIKSCLKLFTNEKCMAESLAYFWTSCTSWCSISRVRIFSE